MGLDQADPRPPYQQIADALRRGITEGRYAPGEHLPSARELAAQYGVAQNTVRSAIGVLRAEHLVTTWQGKGVIVRDPALLDTIPPAFPASALAGHWLTAYRFSGGQHHADVATITATAHDHIGAVNFPPEPRTEGRSVPFRNEIEAKIASRHVTGHWRNLSDTRYFGAVHLAVQPGETIMAGYYTGLATDIEVSCEAWRWVRLDTAGGNVTEVTLREPGELYALAVSRSAHDPLITVADIGEDT